MWQWKYEVDSISFTIILSLSVPLYNRPFLSPHRLVPLFHNFQGFIVKFHPGFFRYSSIPLLIIPTYLCRCCCFLYCTTWAVRPFDLYHTSKDAENYGEEDQPLRWARCWKILEKRSKIGEGRINKMATGRSPSAQGLMIASPHPLHPTLSRCLLAGLAGLKQKEDDLTLRQKVGQITLARSYPKVVAILPSIRSWQVTTSY